MQNQWDLIMTNLLKYLRCEEQPLSSHRIHLQLPLLKVKVSAFIH